MAPACPDRKFCPSLVLTDVVKFGPYSAAIDHSCSEARCHSKIVLHSCHFDLVACLSCPDLRERQFPFQYGNEAALRDHSFVDFVFWINDNISCFYREDKHYALGVRHLPYESWLNNWLTIVG